MDEPTYRINLPKKWVRSALIIVTTALVVAPVTAWAGHRFGDVPNTNIFHGDITWLADNDITRGCNPPANTLFCPKDNVTREQMAAFMRRNAQTFGTAGFAEIETVALGGFPSNVEVATVTVDPKATAGVVLNTSVGFGGAGGSTVWLSIREGSCTGSQLAFADTRKETGTESISLTAHAIVSTATTFKVCAGASPSADAAFRVLTAFWAPTG
jgi:hypothetical protein